MRGPGRLFWKLFLGSLLLAGAMLGICLWLIAREAEAFSASALIQHLTTQAQLLANVVEDRLDAEHAQELDRLAKQTAARAAQPTRITFILSDGRVVGDSMADPTGMESHAQRSEIIQALKTGWGDDIHLSHTVGVYMRYVAVRVGSTDEPRGVVRVAMSTDALGARTRVMRSLVWKIFLVGASALVVFAMGLARLWSDPIKHMTATARSLSRGDLSARIRVRGRDEVAELGHSLNQMRDHLAEQLQTIDHQRHILESLLAQLLEGVVVVDGDGRVLLINPAAVRLLALPGEALPCSAYEKLHVQEFISDPQLRDMLLSQPRPGDAPAPGGSATGGLPLREARIRMQTLEGETALLARSADVRLPYPSDARGEDVAKSRTARLLVLTDVSELTRAMQVKADFAANASHELRTPLSAILGAVEALADMNLAVEAVPAKEFIQMIQRHAARMQAMVADLLDLSRLESTPDQFKVQRLMVNQQVAELHARHAENLKAKRLDWRTEIEPGTNSVLANAHLLRLTLDNLVDNAVKYTEPGGFVRVSCRRAVEPLDAQSWVVFEIADNGCGIPADQQGRVFERFYQVESARSGSLRGTGLGLSIVRHAVAAMCGKVELRSRLGEGTQVSVWVPEGMEA